MKIHSANELQYLATVLAGDTQTVLADDVPCGITDLSGEVEHQEQVSTPRTSHLILMWFLDAEMVTESCYLRIEGVLYVVRYRTDPRKPRPGMWAEIYCVVERLG